MCWEVVSAHWLHIATPQAPLTAAQQSVFLPRLRAKLRGDGWIATSRLVPE
jgi:hypothetical protein